MTADGADIAARVDRRARPPRVHTSLIGRDDELAHLTRLLRSSDASLITVTGRSGSGKTRLALEAANRLGPDLPGGAVVVALDGIPDISMLGTAVASALDLAIAPGQEPEAAIKRELLFQPTLVVADELDALAGAADWFVELLQETPGTRLIATSKSPLHKPSERVIRIGPLIAIDAQASTDIDLMSSPAVTLFADRASAVQYNFKLDRSNLHDVAELCRRVDGLPLAIELAAARCTTLSPGAQLRMIERGSALDLGRRHGGLREAIALSYDMISAADQRVLRSMSVFEGSLSLEAARAVCAPETSEGEFLDVLTTLVDFNLVEADNGSDEPRYHLLPMIREFANELASAAGELEVNVARQTDHYCAFARGATQLPEHLQIMALARERANLETVLGRLMAAGDTVRAARLAADLGWLWERYGWFPVAQHWLEELISVGESDPTIDPGTRALPLIWWVRLSLQHPSAVERTAQIAERQKLGLELARQGATTDTLLLALSAIYFSVLITHDTAAAVAAAFEGLEIARAANNEQWLARFEVSTGVASNLSGDPETAAKLAHSAFARAQRSGDLAGLVAPVFMLLDAADHGQEMTGPIPTPEELLALTRELGDVRGEGWALSRLSAESFRRHGRAASLRWAIEGLELGQRTGMWDATGFAILHLVRVAAANGDDAAVARLNGSIRSVMPELSISVSPEHLASYRALIETVRERSGSANFDRLARSAGQLSWDESTRAALDYARRWQATRVEAPSEAIPEPVSIVVRQGSHETKETKLTRRERQVLSLLATGASNSDVASSLGLSAKTAMHHSMSIYAKLGVRGRAEATVWAFRNGVVAAD